MYTALWEYSFIAWYILWGFNLNVQIQQKLYKKKKKINSLNNTYKIPPPPPFALQIMPLILP